MTTTKQSSLTVVGTGIKFLSHLTLEAKLYIEQADKVLYLVNDPATKEWIKKANSNTESLDDLYFKHTHRVECYEEITQYILSETTKPQHVCVALYGHPSVFAQPALEAARIARIKNIDAVILPGISAEDCLFADLLVNPGFTGCQSYEATDFLLYDREFHTCSHLILWQIGGIGNMSRTTENFDNRTGITILTDKLIEKYHPHHKTTIYQAAQYTYQQPTIESIPLSTLPTTNLNALSTLYIPPAETKTINITMKERLHIDTSRYANNPIEKINHQPSTT